MRKFVVERELLNAGKLSMEELRAISQKSCDILHNLGPYIQWVQSYITDHKVYCIFIAPNEEMIREHARQAGFPIENITEIHSIIDPTIAEIRSIIDPTIANS